MSGAGSEQGNVDTPVQASETSASGTPSPPDVHPVVGTTLTLLAIASFLVVIATLGAALWLQLNPASFGAAFFLDTKQADWKEMARGRLFSIFWPSLAFPLIVFLFDP